MPQLQAIVEASRKAVAQQVACLAIGQHIDGSYGGADDDGARRTGAAGFTGGPTARRQRIRRGGQIRGRRAECWARAGAAAARTASVKQVIRLARIIKTVAAGE